VAVRVHEALEQGETLVDVGPEVYGRDALVVEEAEFAELRGKAARSPVVEAGTSNRGDPSGLDLINDKDVAGMTSEAAACGSAVAEPNTKDVGVDRELPPGSLNRRASGDRVVRATLIEGGIGDLSGRPQRAGWRRFGWGTEDGLVALS
jgi:hypothetical protein